MQTGLRRGNGGDQPGNLNGLAVHEFGSVLIHNQNLKIVQTKFTTDGKKVAIVGKLNNTETIVQEIFVSENGSEIPAGENFVVKSLLDEPAKTWKEMEIEKIEKRYNAARAGMEKEVNDLERKTREMSAYARDKMQWMKSISDNIAIDWFDMVYGFVCAEYSHFVIKGYSEIKIIAFDEFMKPFESNGIRAFGIWSNCDNKVSPILKISTYRDGSDNLWSEVIPCKSYESALNELANLINATEYLNDGFISSCQKYGIKIQEDKMHTYMDKKEAARLKKISELEKEIEKLKQS